VDQLYSLRLGGEGTRPGLRRFHVLYEGSARIARTLALDEALDRLEEGVRLSVASRARQRLFVHAGVVARGGRAVLIPGHSRSGKSTLVAALVKAGATYYSDEYAVLDSLGRVHPFPRPLVLRGPDGMSRRQPEEKIGGRAGVAPLPVALVISTRYCPGGRWRPRRVSSGRGLLALLGHTVPARLRPREAVRVLSRVMDDASVLQGTRGEANDAALAILERLDQSR
jgi:hypothetical protein